MDVISRGHLVERRKEVIGNTIAMKTCGGRMEVARDPACMHQNDPVRTAVRGEQATPSVRSVSDDDASDQAQGGN